MKNLNSIESEAFLDEKPFGLIFNIAQKDYPEKFVALYIDRSG